MERVFTFIGDFNGDVRDSGADSFSDRLSCVMTVVLLGAFALAISTAQWAGGSPMACWCPPHFTDTHEDYTNTVIAVKHYFF